MDGIDFTRAGPQRLAGPVGRVEVVVDLPAVAPLGTAIVAHPQPLLGGHPDHKVPRFLARGLSAAGWLVLRPSFRGVGATEGPHDFGIGETDDVLAVCDAVRRAQPHGRLVLLGFSFGAFVQARVATALAASGHPPWRVCLAGMPFGEVEGNRRYDTPQGIRDALVIHGEQDERVPLAAVFDWARAHAQPVVVVPGADHFFTGRLPALRSLVLAHVSQNAATGRHDR